MEYKHTFFLPLLKLVSKILRHVFIRLKNVCIPRTFLVINVCNQERIYAHPVYYELKINVVSNVK